MASDESTIPDCAAQSCEQIVAGLERAISLRDSGTIDAARIIDVQFADFMRDPIATVRTVYERLGRELQPAAEQKMKDFLAAHPGDHSGARYRWSDTGLDADEVRHQVRAYQERFDVPTEPLR